MFLRVKRKIVFYVPLSSFLCMLLISLTCFFAFRQIIFDRFSSCAVQCVEQNASNASGSFKMAAESCRQVSENEEAALAAAQRSPEKLNELLAGLERAIPGAIGASLYGADGAESYTASRGIPAFLPFSSVAELPGFSEFMSSPQKKTTVFARTGSIPESYYTISSYDPANGLITLASKLVNERGSTCGYLLLDIDPSYVYGFFYYDTETFVSDFASFLASDAGQILPNGLDADPGYLKQAVAGEAARSSDGKNIILCLPLYGEGIWAITLCPLAGYHGDVLKLGLSLAGITLLLTLLSFFIALGLGRSIVKPLSSLSERMESSPRQ